MEVNPIMEGLLKAQNQSPQNRQGQDLDQRRELKSQSLPNQKDRKDPRRRLQRNPKSEDAIEAI